MKKPLVFILAALMALSCLAGCKNKPGDSASSAGPEATTSGTAQTEPVETEPPEENHLPILPLDDSQMADPAARVIDRTPLDGREGLTIPIFIHDGMNLDYLISAADLEIYPNASPYDYSRSVWPEFTPWDLNSISTPTLMRSVYELSVHEYETEKAPQLDPVAQPDALPYYIYASWRGMNWAELAALELRVREDPCDETAISARDEYRDQFLDDFLALQPADLPALPYLYEVLIHIPSNDAGGAVVSEAVGPLRFQGYCMDEDKTSFDIGGDVLVLHAEDDRSLNSPGLSLAAPGYEALVAPLNNGDCFCKVMEFTASEELTLNGFQFVKSKVTIRELKLVRTRNGERTEQVWDGESNLTIYPGETVALWLTLCDQEAKNRVAVISPDDVVCTHDPEAARPGDRVEWANITFGEYRRDQFCALKYLAEGELHEVRTELVLRRDLNPWELIFLFACDKDHQFSEHLYSYYLDYYNPLFNPAWQGETPSLEVTP